MNNKSSVRNLQTLGQNLQLIAKGLTGNQNLLRYLYYTDYDPLNKNKPDVTVEDVFSSHIKIIPVVDIPEKDHSIISLLAVKGDVLSENTDVINILISLEIFVPISQWILKSDSLRPYLIMGEISKSLEGATVKGLGKIHILDFSANFFTEEMSAYKMLFTITEYN